MKKNKDIYSDKNLEGLVKDIIKYIWKVELYQDVLIYSMNKLYYVDEKNPNSKIGKIPITIEDNVDVEEYMEYCNPKTLTISMDSKLCEYLYYYDVPGAEEVSDKISKIFEKHGFYYEFGSSWCMHANPIPNKKASDN